MQALAAVLCLRTSGWKHYEDNIHRANLLFGALSSLWNSKDALLTYVIMRPDELASARRSMLEWPNIKFVYVDENVVINGISDVQFGGWTKQQLLKLAMGPLLPAEFYITLDPDIFCCKPVGADSLVHNGKAVTGWEPKALHTNWWEGAARTLSLPEVQDELVLGVTPNVLSKTISAGLIEHCKSLCDKKWWEHLLSWHYDHGVDTWTEYSLYNTYGRFAGLMDKFHWGPATCKNFPKLISGNSVWDKSHYQNWAPARNFGATGDAYFTVCQSTQLIETREIFEAIKQHLPPPVVARLDKALSGP